MAKQRSDRSHSDPNNGPTVTEHNGLTVPSVVGKHIREQLLAADMLVVIGVFDAAAGASIRDGSGDVDAANDLVALGMKPAEPSGPTPENEIGFAGIYAFSD